MIDPKRLPDWRIGLAGEAAETGDTVLILRSIKVSGHGNIHVPLLEPARLALSIAIRATHSANAIIRRVGYRAHGSTKMLDESSTTPLFDYFEQCIAAIIFSYQGVESYANDVIGRRFRGQTMTLEYRGRVREYSADQLERELSTEEKIATVLPEVLETPFSKSSKTWQNFKALGRARDSIIHWKSKEISGDLDRNSLLNRLMNHRPGRYPRAAIAVIRDLAEYNTEDWLQYAEAELDPGKGEPNP